MNPSIRVKFSAGSAQRSLDQQSSAIGEGLSITGILISSHYRYSLPGLKVSAHFVERVSPQVSGCDNSPQDEETLLGEAWSDAGGSFQIRFHETLNVRRRLLAVMQFAEPQLVLKVANATGQVYFISAPMAGLTGSIVANLSIPLPDAEVTNETWATIGARLRAARIRQVHDLTRALASFPDHQAIFADWELEMRHAVLTRLEQAFLDPQNLLRDAASPMPSMSDLRVPGVLATFYERLHPHLEDENVKAAFADFQGKVASFADLFAVDWVMDLSELRIANVGNALNAHIGDYRSGSGGVYDRSLYAETDLSRYRDYLLAIWTDWITRVGHQLTSEQAIDQLVGRFHQDFATLDIVPQSANAILSSIVRDILTAPTGKGWGFGIHPGTIPPQGARSTRDYLDHLCSRTGLSAHELGLRFRLNFLRPDSELSSRVQENIATLQGLFRDSFQCELEPFHVDPDVLNQPIVPSILQGKAPFFLQYDEWLRQQTPFYGENFFDIRRTLPVTFDDNEREQVKVNSTIPNYGISVNNHAMQILDMVAVHDALVEGHTSYERGWYPAALTAYLKAQSLAESVMQGRPRFDPTIRLTERVVLSVNTAKELAEYMAPSSGYIDQSSFYDNDPGKGDWTMSKEVDRMTFKVGYYHLFVIPICLADAYLALGDYETAVSLYGHTTGFLVATAKESDSGGYIPEQFSSFAGPAFRLYGSGDRPYTVKLVRGEHPQLRYFSWVAPPYFPHPVEAKYFRLRQANAMLEWSDALYRTNDASNIARARELYKGVLWLHGSTPPISPTWHDDGRSSPVGFNNRRENPALTSQKARAQAGFVQIEAGLNYYGETNDIVPVARYRQIKETADRFAARAKSSQADFLVSTEKLENALVNRLRLAALIQKTSLQASIVQQQTKIAEYNVIGAKEQVANVEAQIAGKRQEIEDADSFSSQLGDFVGGMVKTFTSLPGDMQSVVKGGFVAEVTGKELVGQSILGLGAGASILGGFAIFGAAGYMTLSSMSDASNRRRAELRSLMEKALPAGIALVQVKQREVAIANYQQRIVEAELDLARDLIHFEANRFLNANFWLSLAQVLRRMLRRYLELGARLAWLAERALAYEQDRPISIIRLDYFPEMLQGVTGADLLESDLAELEATRIEGIAHTAPIKYTLSLLRDYPLQFGQLKKTGRCTFTTEESPFNLAYPGTTMYRIRAVSVTVSQTSLTNPMRGLLINRGVSISRPGQSDEHVLVRPAEAQPISEFRLKEDMAVYGLPDESLLTFEGGCIETMWELNLPAAANPYGYDGIADVLLTFDLRAHYSPALYAEHLANVPTEVRRWVFISSKQYQPQAILNFTRAAATSVKLDFDLSAQLPRRESKRKLKNVVIFVVSGVPLDIEAQFRVTQPATVIRTTFLKGIAMSNLPPAPSDPVPVPLPLNALENVAADQVFELIIDKTQNPRTDFKGVTDIVLGVEYEAKVV